MSKKIQETFDRCREAGKPAFVAYVTAGYPSPSQTVDILLAMEAGGADIIELGVPFSDPIADGVTLQKTSEVALKHGVTYQHCVDFVKAARAKGLKAPVILMGYFNPLIAIGEEHAVKAAADAGADGFIVVDAPLEEAGSLLKKCAAHHMSLVPLVTPTTTEDRMDLLSKMEDTFVYCVSVTGVTGERDNLPDDLEQFIARVRKHTSLPLAVGFGISTRAHVDQIAAFADGVVVGSAISKLIDSKGVGAVKGFIHELTSRAANGHSAHKHHTAKEERAAKKSRVEMQLANGDTGAHQQWITKLPDRFGEFGGMFVPETLMAALRELEDAYVACTKDPSFFQELEALQKSFVGRPTPMYFAKRLTEHCGGAKIWFKREELAHTGAHKINNTLGQILVAKRLGKKRIVAETGAGQHGVATATVCALLGLQCVVYMGTEDIKRQSLNVFRMKMLGATVIPAETGSRTLKDAVNEAMRDWVTNVRTTYYLIGSALGPHPFPTMVRDFQSVIGREAREQIQRDAGRLPDVVIACVGGGSNAIGMFHAFVPDKTVKLIGVEAAGSGIASGKHSASIIAGVPGVLHGMRTYLLQDAHGQISDTHSISAGLDYPGVGPEHCYLKSIGRADYVPIDDNEALDALQVMSRHEGIIPALEPSHAIAYALKLAPTMKSDEIILVNLCGRGDKDMVSVATALGYDL